jgi:hypothetical protein
MGRWERIMTKQASFKAKVRARMQKTGERYAAARAALLRDVRPSFDGGVPVVPGYRFESPLEHDTGLLTSALAQAGVVDPGTGVAFAPERVFGLSGGIGFMYFVFEYAGHPPTMTFTCRSWSMPGPLLARALDAAGIRHARSETGSAAAARRFLDEALGRGAAVHVTVDAASLPGSAAPPAWIGSMPIQANVVGREDDRYAVDLGGPAVLDAATLARARAAVRKERHRALTFEAGPAPVDAAEATRTALRGTARAYVEAPFKGYAANFGLAGLEKLGRLATDERDPKGWPRLFDTGPLAFLALTRAWACLTLELTPPAGGRAFYADFLGGARATLAAGAADAMAEAEALARRSADRLARLTDDLVAAGGDEVARGVGLLEEIDATRRVGGRDAAVRIGELEAERQALMDGCSLDRGQRVAAYALVGEAFRDVHGLETELQALLVRVAA